MNAGAGLETVFDVDVDAVLLDDLLLSFDVDVGFTDVVAFELDLLVVLTDDEVLTELFELDLLVVDVFNEVFELV
jgi:hypothetical protein